MKKISLLGLVLLTVSSVATALLPKKSKDFKQANSADNATLCSESGMACGSGIPPLSCVPDNTLNYSCHLTNPSLTGVRSDLPPNGTIGNTSISWLGTGHAGDTTSEIN